MIITTREKANPSTFRHIARSPGPWPIDVDFRMVGGIPIIANLLVWTASAPSQFLFQGGSN
jgi:hypothetical protein